MNMNERKIDWLRRLQLTFNKVWITREIPEDWKRANVVPKACRMTQITTGWLAQTQQNNKKSCR